MPLSFVLLARPARIDTLAVCRLHSSLFPGAPTLRAREDHEDGASLEAAGCETLVHLLPAPVPRGEAEANLRFSAGNEDGSEHACSAHRAHFVVLSKDAATALETRIQHLRVVAAIVSTHPAIAIYDGQATHLRSFYLEESSSECPISVLSAVDRLPDEHGRVVFIAFDPGRFGAPDLVVTTPVIGAAEAYNFLVNLCWYVIARGKPLLAGETVGRSASEILELREARHPIDAKRRVLRVELPGS